MSSFPKLSLRQEVVFVGSDPTWLHGRTGQVVSIRSCQSKNAEGWKYQYLVQFYLFDQQHVMYVDGFLLYPKIPDLGSWKQIEILTGWSRPKIKKGGS